MLLHRLSDFRLALSRCPCHVEGDAILLNYIEKKLHTVYPMLYKPTLKNSKN